MRRHLIASALVLVASAAAADPKPKKIDIKAVADKLDVYTDAVGNILVTPKPLVLAHDNETWVFYGTKKTLYQQRVVASSVIEDKLEWMVWSPRVNNLVQAIVHNDSNGAEVRCKSGAENHQKLTPMPGDQAKVLLAKVAVFGPLWPRSAHFLARDDDGVYFYIDVLREEHGGKGHRVFVGQKGSMKEQSLTNIVSDTAGEIYATKTGELKIVAGADGKVYWKKGGKRTELIRLDAQANRYLIYRELGIYGTLGVVCDEN